MRADAESVGCLHYPELEYPWAYLGAHTWVSGMGDMREREIGSLLNGSTWMICNYKFAIVARLCRQQEYTCAPLRDPALGSRY